MASPSVEFARLHQVPITVGGFSGPLDLLLELVRARQLPVTSVSLCAVTEQFLAALQPIEEAQPELLADFLAVASRLTALKARALLPRPGGDGDGEEPLVMELRRYAVFRDAATWLREREAAGLRSFARPPLPRRRETVTTGRPEQLRRALDRLVRRSARPFRPFSLAPVISLSTMMQRIRARLRGRQTFRRLLGERPTRSEVVVGVLALLTLARRCVVEFEQVEPFGEIWVWSRDEHEG